MARKTKKIEPTGIVAYKGLDKDFRCRGFQYEVGKTYEHQGSVVACESGFHACGYPLDVFGYYPPATSRFALVTQSGDLARKGGDTKVASAKITIDAEIHLPEIVVAAVKWVFDRAKWIDGPVATGDNEAATASGYQGAATASGTQGAATASGDRGAATASGTQGAATASGARGAATASGYQGAATASGTRGAATASGDRGKARGIEGTALFLVHRHDDGNITHARAEIVGRNGIKPDVWYMLDETGVFVEA
jgi:hypothetical protein